MHTQLYITITMASHSETWYFWVFRFAADIILKNLKRSDRPGNDGVTFFDTNLQLLVISSKENVLQNTKFQSDKP